MESRYSRRNRSQHIIAKEPKKEFKKFSEDSDSLRERIPEREEQKQSSFYAWPLLALISLLLGSTYYSFPLTHRVPQGILSQYFYSGFAMQHGQTPYINFAGRTGVGFYLFNWLGNFGGSTWLLWLLEILVLFISGVLVFKIIVQATADKKLSLIVGLVFLILTAGILQGGNSPAEFALPFVLYGVHLLNSYFTKDSDIKDERFILYGMAGAFAVLISPLSALLWLFAFFWLFVKNVADKHFWRGFYQFLASLFGILVVFAFVGYYTLNAGIFYPVIEQSVLIPLKHFQSLSQIGLAALFSLALLLIFGLLTLGGGRLKPERSSSVRHWHRLLILTALVSFLLMIVQKTYLASDTVLLIPFLILFVGLKLERVENGKKSGLGFLILDYLRTNWFLPVLGLAFLIALPFYQHASQATLVKNEKEAASFVKTNSKPSDGLLLLSDNAAVSILSERTSSMSVWPSYFPISYQQKFDTAVSNMTDKYVVIDKDYQVPASLTTTLKASYTPAKITNSQYLVYQKK